MAGIKTRSCSDISVLLDALFLQFFRKVPFSDGMKHRLATVLFSDCSSIIKNVNFIMSSGIGVKKTVGVDAIRIGKIALNADHFVLPTMY